LLQLDYIVDQNKVYHKKYPYLPGITKQVDLEQKEFADDVLKKISLKKNDLVIDIGSNDGNLLKHFKKKIKVLGVEPTNIAKIANKNKIKTIIHLVKQKLLQPQMYSLTCPLLEM
jgi:cyclopropane fatty-acyl-phospholipid synthase-like methyltransferase